MNNLLISDVTVDSWVQAGPIKMNDLLGSVVLIEVFQVNCPGCFLYALPDAIELHKKYSDKGLVIIGLATAFEDYDKNTLENLQLLVNTGEVVGETFKAMNQHGLLVDNSRLPWKLPFAIGMDRIEPDNDPVTDERVLAYARQLLTQFDTLQEDQKKTVQSQIRVYLEQKIMKAETFERFSLQGTPSAILFDREGQLQDVSFGQVEHKQPAIEQLLACK
ncbi:thiol-disulfide isomerase [Nitrosomonas aestuarii]|uniref:AhpC/TSA family protein n=1 Tax=Nitrosomonas aestuarii TaxID=52441 RepID=A0A1I3YQ63_9PROT|nr:thiol-disulfide isomerase [Nitrosomonas aestuarii]PTN12633.1 hypothetical protein C8R11_103201 [Nitrosomonas aestuarii]SFK33499.1 hypothetical protein SAMN05216302_100482 [Nitrosomonas aestuarii]